MTRDWEAVDALADPAIVEPAIFWLWNITPTADEIRARLDEFRAKGFAAVYVHPMPDSFRPHDFHGGMDVEYLSDDFFKLIRLTCDELHRRGMIMWLYDEGGWPSGVAGGRVVAENADFGAWVLRRDASGAIRSAQRLAELNYPDLMNPLATDAFIRHTHERCRKFIGEQFGKTVRGIFTDEPRLLGRLGTDEIPYSPLLDAAFESRFGRRLQDVTHLLFDPPSDDSARRVWRQYIHTYSDLIAENFFGPIRRWCRRNALLFEGHHSGESEFSTHGQYFGDFLQQARHYDIPGVDTIWRQIFPGQIGGNFVSLASSSAWLRGQRVATSESFSVYGPGLTLHEMRWIAAYQIVRGVNKIGVMPSMQSMRGPRRVGLCTDFSPRTPIWRDVDLYTSFQRHAARFSLRGDPVATAGVYYRPELIPDRSAAAEFDRTHEEICDRIGDQFAPMMFVGADELKQGGRAVDALRVLVVHATELEPAEVELFDRLKSQGMRIVHARTPQNVDVRDAALLIPDSPVAGVRLLMLKESNALRGLMLFNQNDMPVEFSFRFADGQRPALREVILDESVLSSRAPLVRREDRYHLRLDAGEMRAWEPSSAEVSIEPWHPHEQIVLRCAWSVREHERFVIGDDIEIEKLPQGVSESMKELGDYAVAHPHFSGSLIYRTTFEWAANDDRRVVLDLGEVCYSAEVTLNGTPIGRRAWPPYRFDATGAIRAGQNELSVRVTNTLANQWLRPDVHERDVRLHMNQYLQRSIPFMRQSVRSGLLGPVTIQSCGRQ